MEYEPSQKAPGMDQDLTNIFGFDRREFIKSAQCVPVPFGCGKLLTETDFAKSGEVEGPFRDRQSAKEYTISGLCQDCQDDIYGNGEDEDDD